MQAGQRTPGHVPANRLLYAAAHLRAPCGLWRIVCGCPAGRTLRDGDKVVFSHLVERRR